MKYKDFLESKRNSKEPSGFEPIWIPDFLYDFQRHLVDWSIRRGRSALFEECGLGKTPQALVWAENVLRKENKPVLIFTPLAVSKQFVREGAKFGVDVHNARDGRIVKGINVVNYQRMHHFDSSVLGGVVCDESSCLKHFDSKTRIATTDFLSRVKYRLLDTATPAPNDFMELGTSSEALGEMARNQMLGMFFTHKGNVTQQWELKGHANKAYWRWMAGWARAVRKPSDLGYEDDIFLLPELREIEHVIPYGGNGEGDGFFFYANTLNEQRAEKRRSLKERCEKVAELVSDDRPTVIWCDYNPEGDLLEKLIPDAIQVAGKHSDELKEERLNAFSCGQIRVLVTKAKIGGWGLNWQHCADIFTFPTHSWESDYQRIRRCWRFGQKKSVTVHRVLTNAERPILKNMNRKDRQASKMFQGIVSGMHDYQVGKIKEFQGEEVKVPSWL